RRSGTPSASARLARLRPPAGYLVRLLLLVPRRPAPDRPGPDQGGCERPPRDLARAASDPSPLRADRREDRRLLLDAPDRDGVDLLELGVHRDRAGAPLGLPPPARRVQALPQHHPARERDRSRRLLADADGAAVDVPRQGIRG